MLNEDEDKFDGVDPKDSVRVVDKNQKTVLIRYDIVRQKWNKAVLAMYNHWETREDEDLSESKQIAAQNKMNGSATVNPLICLRTLVSKKKKRLKTEGFNLDLTYITNYVVALGYPAEGLETAIRNSRNDVIRFFKRNHGVNVKIYNLCIEHSKQYEQEKIPEFSYCKSPFWDH